MEAADTKANAAKKFPFPTQILIPLALLLLVSIPTVLAALPVLLANGIPTKLATLILAPITLIFSYVGLAILISLPFQKAIVKGKFPRELSHFIYGPRRLYGLCWCAFFYCTPIYFAFNSVALLWKWATRGFGYRGSTEVTIAPDAWIRDLPLLKFEKGTYIANRATMGSNICLSDGHVFVDAIHLGEKTMVGHLAIVGPGVKTGAQVEVGIGCVVGIRISVGANTRLGPTSGINHGAQIGSNVDIGSMSYVGVKAIIADGVKLPSFSNVPEGVEIKTQEDVIRHMNVEKQDLTKEIARLGDIYKSRVAM